MENIVFAALSLPVTCGAKFNFVESYQIQDFIGEAFAWKKTTTNFYTNSRGINYVGFTYHPRTISAVSYNIPVQVTPASNPNAEHHFPEIAIPFL